MMKNIVLIIFLGIVLIYANDFSLKDATKTVNISVNSVDIDDLLEKSKKEIDKIDFKKLKFENKSSNYHKKRIDKAIYNLKLLSGYRQKLELSYIDRTDLAKSLTKAKKLYDRNINRIYRANKQIDRYTYILVVSKGDLSYESDLENFVIDKYAIKKYDQTTTLEKSLQSTKMQNTIKTQKEFGQKYVDTIYDYIIRSENLNLAVLKVTQNPFVKLSKMMKNKTQKVENDVLKESTIFINDLSSQDFAQLQQKLQKKYSLDISQIKPFISELKDKVDITKQKKDFQNSTNAITNVLKKLETQHEKELQNIATIDDQYKAKINMIKSIEPKLNNLLSKTQKLLKPYNIRITKETIGNITIVTPKVYKQRVDNKEESEFILRKINSFVSRINISDLKQSDLLIDFEDLTSTTKKTQKIIEYETIHALPYIEKNNEMGLLIFGSISIKDKLNEDDMLSFPLSYTTLKFVPIKKGYKTIFTGQKEVTLGLVKEFLEENSFKRNFDQYCIDESSLPDEAKDYKNITSEFFDYPAVCFKVDKIDTFIKWVSKKINRDIVIPSSNEWGYVASNSQTTEYCWGDESLDDLIDEDIVPENIYLENSDTQSAIKKVAKYPKSKSGLYDMCGNVFELTKDEDELTYKGNSFSSYIEVSIGDGEVYSQDINSNLGLRLFYIKDLTNE